MRQLGDLGESLFVGARALVGDWVSLALGTERSFTLCPLDAGTTLVTFLRTIQLREPDHRLCLVEIAAHGDVLLAGAPQGVQRPSLPIESRLYSETASIRGVEGSYTTTVAPVDLDALEHTAMYLRQAARYGRSTILLNAPLQDAEWFPLLRCLQVLELCVDPDGSRLETEGLRQPLMQAFVRAASAWDVIPYLGLVDATGRTYLMAPGNCAAPGSLMLDPAADRDLVAWLVGSLRESATGAAVFTEPAPARRPAAEIRADIESANPERIKAGLRDAVDAMDSLADAPLRSLSPQLLSPIRRQKRMEVVDLLCQLTERCEHVVPPLSATDRRRLLLDLALWSERATVARVTVRAIARAEDPAAAVHATIAAIADRDLSTPTSLEGPAIVVRELFRAPPNVRAGALDELRRHQAKLAKLLAYLPKAISAEVRGA